MYPIIHFLSSLVLVIILYPFYGLMSLVVFIGGFFIDIDHYFYYVFEKRIFHPLRCYQELTREAVLHKKQFQAITKRPLYMKWDRLHIFHVWEFWLLILFLSFFHSFFFLVLLGMILHLGLDFIDLFSDRVYGRRALSLFGWLYRYRSKRK